MFSCQLAKELQIELNKLQGVRNDGIDLGTIGAALEGNDSQDPILEAAPVPDDFLDPIPEGPEGSGEVDDSQDAPQSGDSQHLIPKGDAQLTVPEDGDSQKVAPEQALVAHPNSTDPAGMDSDNQFSTDVSHDSEDPVTLDGYEGSVMEFDEGEVIIGDGVSDSNLMGMLQSQIGAIAPCTFKNKLHVFYLLMDSNGSGNFLIHIISGQSS